MMPDLLVNLGRNVYMYAAESFIILGLVHIMNAWKTLVHMLLRVIDIYVHRFDLSL